MRTVWSTAAHGSGSLACRGREHQSRVVRRRPGPALALGIEIGTMPPGPTNSIVDVADVSVGHATVWFDEPAPPAGRGVARTGVTAIVPFSPGEVFHAPRSGRSRGAQRRR